MSEGCNRESRTEKAESRKQNVVLKTSRQGASGILIDGSSVADTALVNSSHSVHFVALDLGSGW